MNLAETIKHHRNRKGYTQTQLAEKVFVTRQAVSSWETGRTRPDFESVKLLASVLDVDLSEFNYSEMGSVRRLRRMVNVLIGVVIVTVIGIGYTLVSSFLEEEPEVIPEEPIVEIVEVEKVIEHSYEINSNYIDYDTEEMEQTIETVLSYVSENYLLEETSFTFGLSTIDSRFDPVKDEILINITDYNNLDIIYMTLSMVEDHDANFGLLYGYAEYIAEELGIEYEPITEQIDLTKEELEEYWYLSDTQFVGFSYEIATAREIQVTKWISSSKARFITDKYGIDELKRVIKESSVQEQKIYRDEWINSLYDNFNGLEFPWIITFENHNDVIELSFTKQPVIVFETEGLLWKLNPKGEDNSLNVDFDEKFGGENSIVYSVAKFYEHMNVLLENKEFADEMLKQDGIYYRPLMVELYYDFESRSQYDSNVYYIGVQTLMDFPEVYVNYLESTRFLNEEIDEENEELFRQMRSWYYTIKTPLFGGYSVESFETTDDTQIHEDMIPIRNFVNEHYSELNAEDRYEVFLHVYAANIGEEPLEWTRRDDPFVAEWVSLLTYIEDIYGFEEVDQITLNSEWTSGETVDWDQLVADWKEFLNDNYYFVELDSNN